MGNLLGNHGSILPMHLTLSDFSADLQSQAVAETAGVNKPQDLCLTAPPGITGGVAFDVRAEMAWLGPGPQPENGQK